MRPIATAGPSVSATKCRMISVSPHSQSLARFLTCAELRSDTHQPSLFFHVGLGRHSRCPTRSAARAAPQGGADRATAEGYNQRINSACSALSALYA
eukprot:2066859-Alexandrium_andersonii.AAC.1